ncbi:hypothetical protein CHGG_01386 [Chaetomium globosum CBS 148.51]|uniref:Chromate transporter n=1 Tax=Chaetomium globosum (strain ATCC 6205 / CBS 148.51 / DSM 1962 / NBRC 6347 / NRRL 1970) TaxID=306901 RepID=Q2HEG8_CHAGB|nr:uncharacterized protein CHGG_01386 [Chaetomium globosum CBS 148.51]EAQ93151.1 hypothetical protein CHGG_01386 [Chaetomium globosum CBS 148.51]
MGVKTGWSPTNWAWDNLWERDLSRKLWNTVRETWYLGFTSFGGPPVHFKIFHDKFVTKLHWIDEEVAFSGPGSTKMLYCINLIHDGFLSAVLGFLIWSLPAALGMFGLAIGISNVNETLPGPVYALLSGLNAATVGIIALAAVQLAQKAITDKLTRLLVFLGAAAGLLYNALWYFPLLMLIAGIIAVIHDFRWLHGPVNSFHTHPAFATPSTPSWTLKFATARNRHHLRWASAMEVSRTKLTVPKRALAGRRSDSAMELVRGLPIRLMVVTSRRVLGGAVRANRSRMARDHRAYGGRCRWMAATKEDVLQATLGWGEAVLPAVLRRGSPAAM